MAKNTRGRWGCAIAVVLSLTALVCGGAALCCGLPVVGALGVRAQADLRERVEPGTAGPGRVLATPEGRLHAQVWGEGDSHVVLMHGSAAWSGTWPPVAEPLSALGHHVAAIDLPPFGYSERPADGDYSRPAQARRIWAGIDALGWSNVTLVGHSFGAGPVMEAAMLHPERVDAVVLVSGALSLGSEPVGLGPLSWRPLREVAIASTFTQPAFLPIGLQAMVWNEAAVTPEWIARYQTPLEVRGTTGAVADWLPELFAPSPCPSLDPERYRQFRRPVSMVWGDHDTTTPPSQMDALKELLPHAQTTLLPDVGHLPPVEATAAVVDEIDRACP